MSTLVLLHGSANGAYSWGPVRKALAAAGAQVFAPDLVGYGQSPAASPGYGIEEEVAHLRRLIDAQGIADMHLVAHSLGTMFALHLRLGLGARVSRMTLIDPVMVSVLRAPGQEAAYDEMETIYQACMSAPDDATAARLFVEHWNGGGAWGAIGERARAVITSLVPKVKLEMTAARSDLTALPLLAESPPPTTILTGEKTRVAPRATASLLQEALAAQVVVVPGAGHMIPLTHPAAIVEALQKPAPEPAAAAAVSGGAPGGGGAA